MQTNRDLNMELAKRMVNTPVEITSRDGRSNTRKIEELKKALEQMAPQQGSKPATQGAQGTPAANKPAEKR